MCTAVSHGILITESPTGRVDNENPALALGDELRINHPLCLRMQRTTNVQDVKQREHFINGRVVGYPQFSVVHQVSDWCSGAAANFDWMREAKRENTRCGL